MANLKTFILFVLCTINLLSIGQTQVLSNEQIKHLIDSLAKEAKYENEHKTEKKINPDDLWLINSISDKSTAEWYAKYGLEEKGFVQTNYIYFCALAFSLLIVFPSIYLRILRKRPIREENKAFVFEGPYSLANLIRHVEDLEEALDKQFPKFKKQLHAYAKYNKSNLTRFSDKINAELFHIKLNYGGRKRLLLKFIDPIGKAYGIILAIIGVAIALYIASFSHWIVFFIIVFFYAITLSFFIGLFVSVLKMKVVSYRAKNKQMGAMLELVVAFETFTAPAKAIRQPAKLHYNPKQFVQQGQIYTFSRGPQFNRLGAKYAFMLLLLFLGGTLASLANGQPALFFFLLLITVPLTFYMLDIRGVQIDVKQKRIRPYSIMPWGYVGQWNPITAYEQIKIKRKNELVKSEMGFIRPTVIYVENFVFTYVILQSEKPALNVEIAAYNHDVDAKRFAKDFSKLCGLPVHDNAKEIIAKRKKR